MLSGVKHSYGILLLFYFLFKFYSSATCKELFNFQHAKAQNVIERSFGVIKWQFKILVILPEYSRDVQAWLFSALVVIHNFIHEWDPIKITDILPPSDDNVDMVEDFRQLATEYPRQAEKGEVNARHDQCRGYFGKETCES